MKHLMENWRRFVNEEKEKSKEEEEFEPHMMYDPETGEGKKAETYEQHVELDKKGWGHDKPEVDEGKNKGLWANIHAKKKRMKAGSGEKKAKPGDDDYPETLDVDEAKYKREDDPCQDGYEQIGMKPGKDGGKVPNCVPQQDEAKVLDKYDDEVEKENEASRKRGMKKMLQKEEINTLFTNTIFEETDKDRMKCNSPRYIKEGEPGYGKKQKVVKACDGDKEKIIRFGDAKMENKSDDKDSKKNFRSRHNCDEKKDKLSAGYWSCKDW